MTLIIKPVTIKSLINKLVRKTQRVEITSLHTNVLTIRNVYKNKQIIDVTCNAYNRCLTSI